MDKTTEKIIKKGSELVEGGKRRKITDFDSGLLQQSFESIIGNSQEKYEKWCEHLVNVATRLENLHLNDKVRLTVLDDIDEFFKIKLPQISSGHTDFDRKTLYHEIARDDGKTTSCTTELYNNVVMSIREEQYFNLTNKARVLVYKAKARLETDTFKWHRSNITKE